MFKYLAVLVSTSVSLSAYAKTLECTFKTGPAGAEVSDVQGPEFKGKGEIKSPVRPYDINQVFQTEISIPNGSITVSSWFGVNMPKESYPGGNVLSLAFDYGKIRIATPGVYLEGLTDGHFVVGTPGAPDSVRIRYTCLVR